MVQRSEFFEQQRNMMYRPEIDGMRAVAVLLVIVFHAGFDQVSGGFIGVDIFFVLSGYLITGIILREIEGGHFSLVTFYEKRARRILPPLVLVIALTYVAGYFLFPPMQLQWLGQSALAGSLFAANIYFIMRGGDYFSSEAFYPLKHLWSLGVEEQFYLVFPIVLLLIVKLRREMLQSALMVIFALSFLYAQLLPNVNYYDPIARTWELLAGSLCALLPSQQFRGRIIRNIGATLGMVVIFFAAFMYNENTPFPSAFTLLPILGAVLVIVFADQKTIVAKALSWPPMVYIGLISYGLYLWHYPVLIFAQYYWVDTTEMIPFFASMALIATLTLLSYRFIERPIRYKVSTASARNSVALFLLTVSMLLASVGYQIHRTGGLLARDNISGLPENYFENAGKIPRFVKGVDGKPCTQICAALSPVAENETWLLVGDSHANDFRENVRELAIGEGANLYFLIIPNCNYTPERCPTGFERLRRTVRDRSADKVLFVSSLSNPSPTMSGRLSESHVSLFQELLESKLSLYFFLPRARFSDDPVRMALGGKLSELRLDQGRSSDSGDARAAEISQTYSEFHIIDQNGVLFASGCGDAACFTGHTPENLPLYRDTNHLTTLGASVVFRSATKMLVKDQR